jgi:hypothetical protein
VDDVIEGTLIGESLRAGSSVDGLALTVRRIRRGGPAELSAAQRAAGIPATWTLVDFEVPASEGERLAAALAGALDDVGWYVDFRSADETFVVFAGRVFRYRRGDARGRSEAQVYARTKGVPDSQLDWPE